MRALARALGLSAALALSACAAAPEGAPLDALPDGVWRLQPAGHGEFALADQHPVTLQFADGQATGDAGCNLYSASAAVVDGRLQLGTVVRTKRSCGAERDALEQAFLAALAKAGELRRAGEQLQIGLTDGRVLLFTADKAAG